MKAIITVTAFLTVLSASSESFAKPLVQNGGFETGNFVGWTQFGDMSRTSVYAKASNPVYDGTYSAAFGPDAALGGITQTINTVPGENYNVSFAIANTDISSNNQFIFSFNDGFQIISQPLPAFGFENFTLPVKASGLTADVSFFFYNPAGHFLLDDVAVIPAVPEPASWGLLLAGFATIGAAMRRRQPLAA